ncbi:MAG TPA: hypothetical protein VGD69_10000 [Herpetosiphonaceae bacterium]
MTNHDHDQPADEQPPEAAPAAPPADAEQIGSLIFVPNPEYPYPFKVATPPRFWMEETTGALNEAVDTYMNGEKLTTEQLDRIKLYLRQYIERAVLSSDANKKLLLSKIDKLKTTADVERYADEISEYGAEVF